MAKKRTTVGLDISRHPVKAAWAEIRGARPAVVRAEILRLASTQAESAGIHDFDSDSDGLTGGWEVRYGMNPLSTDSSSADPDGDGWTNAQEAAAGTNPFLADSDEDGAEDDVDGNPLLADQGSDPGGPPLTVLTPVQGENILW